MGIAADADLNLGEVLTHSAYGLLRAAWMALPSKESSCCW